MQPVIISDNISVAANSVNDNVIASNASLRRYLRAPFPFQGKLLAVQSAAGLRIDMDYGSKNVVASSDPRVSATLDNVLDVINANWHGLTGDQLVLRVANTTAGALTLRYLIVLDPLGEPGSVPNLPPDARVIQRGPISIAAAAVDVQLLDGLRYERAPVPSTLDVLMTASAAGLLSQLFVEADSIAPPSAVNPNNRVPQYPFDVQVEDVEAMEDKLIQLSVSNPTGGALSVFWKTVLSEYQRT